MKGIATCLTVILVIAACRDEPDHARAHDSDTLAPIGTGTELLLTRERLALIDDWIRASIARDGTVPASLDHVRPPEAEAAHYAPLERFLRDGWGRAIEYTPGTASYELRSVGADGIVGTPDDVTTRQR
ncbi:MAG TPA: type II secretion system protein GspG [Gemmatimonadaceae bacterium]|nr:type II secretion system protein GspG [Gemmatimonadaceae bacterium]